VRDPAEAAAAESHPAGWQVPFFTIWIGQALSLVGSNVAQFALVWWLTKLTGSATVLATASMVSIIPQVFLGPFAGAYVDRWNRRVVMLVADSFIALVSLWLAYLFWADRMQVWHVYAVMIARALGGIFHWPAMSASTSLMVPKKHLARVAGLNQTLHGALNVAGPPLGAFLLSLLPLYGVMLIDVGTAAFAILPLFFVFIPQLQRTQTAGAKPTILDDVREGLRYIWQWTGMRILLGMAMVLNFVLAPASSLSPLLVTEHFGGEAMQLGWFNSSWGAGALIGGLTLSVWGGFRRRIYTSLMGVTLLGVGAVTLGLTPAALFWLALAANFMLGVMNPIANGPLSAVFQAIIAPEMQGRVFMVVGSMCTAMMPLSLAIAGPLADVVGVRAWYVVGGVLCMVMGAGAFFVPAIVNIEDQSKGATTADA
jgi:DHA3 family macrolide efflux protein-like MFS transporter